MAGYISFFGGEPLLHPRLTDMIAMSIAKGMGPALINNGWLLPSIVGLAPLLQN
jgi:MoaA/NifB/PqqE/SkfB family radical SAM enzyme